MSFYLDWAFQGLENMEFAGLGRLLMWGSYLTMLVVFVRRDGDELLVSICRTAGVAIAATFFVATMTRRHGFPPADV